MPRKLVEEMIISVKADEYEFRYISNIKRKKKVMKLVSHKKGKVKDVAFATLTSGGQTTLHFIDGIKITKKLQERLHSLAIVGMKAVRTALAPPTASSN